MAVHLSTVSDYLKRTSNLLPLTTPTATRMVWTRNNASVTGPSANCAYAGLDAWPVSDSEGGLFTEPIDLSDLYVQRPSGFFTDLTGNTLSDSVWHHLCWTVESNVHRLYLDGILQGSPFSFDLAGAPTPAVTNLEVLGSDGFGSVDHDVAYYRAWSGTALTQAQIQAEMVSEVPVITANCFQSNSLDGTYADQSGHNRTWTSVGSVSFTTGPTLVPNAGATTATVIPSLPYSITLPKLTPGTINPSVWFTYTPQVGEVVVGPWAFTSLASPHRPSITVWYGPAANPARLSDVVDINSATNVPYSVPVRPGTQYFFEVVNAGLDDAGTAALTFSVEAQPSSNIPAGSLFVNDETYGFPVAILSSYDGSVLNFHTFAAGESADVQPTGEVLAESIDFNGDPLGLQIYSFNLAPQTLIPYPASFDEVYHIWTSYLGGWWVDGSATTTTTSLVKVLEDGTIDPTDYTITHSSTTQPIGMASNPDDTILYYARTGTANAAIQRWDLVNDAALTDLVSSVASYNVMQDILCLSDGTVVVGYKKTTATRDSYVVQYAADGSTLHTYHVGSSTMAINRLCRAVDNPNSFWVWLYPQAASGTINGTNRYINVEVATGTLLKDFTVTQYERGNYAANPSAQPDFPTARFGPSFSCPMWVNPVPPLMGPPLDSRGGFSAPPPTVVTTTEYLIRRERVFPVVDPNGKRIFFSFLQLILNSGNGLTTGQGSDPLVELDWSKDGGHTWSNIHYLQSGKIGAYQTRLIQRRLGWSHNGFVFRVAVTDPVQWSLINAIGEFQVGTA